MNISVLSLDSIARIDPSPFFVISLIPYLVFLHYAGKTKAIPKISFIGFKLTLLFAVSYTHLTLPTNREV